nr:hypothetical protein [Tanacetum cinerariifolium]
PAIAPESPPALSPPIAPYRRRRTVKWLRKTVRPQPPLPPAFSGIRSGSSKRPNGGLRCRVSPTPALHIAAELAVMTHVLPSMPIELLPPCKRFTAMEMIQTLKREVVSLRVRLAAVKSQIDALQRDDIGTDVREVGLKPDLREKQIAVHFKSWQRFAECHRSCVLTLQQFIKVLAVV